MVPLYLNVMGGAGVLFAFSGGAVFKHVGKELSSLDLCDWIVIAAAVIVVLFSLSWFIVGKFSFRSN